MSRLSKFDEKLDNAWNAGLYLREVPKFMARFGFTDVQAMIAGWRARKKEFGCKCIVRGKPRPHTESELATYVTIGMFGSTYGNWLGVTGPGKQLREMLKKQ